MDDDIINQAENFIANNVSDIVHNWQTKTPNLNIDKTAFFGVMYEDNSRDFKFSIGDKLQIRALAAHVKNIVGENNEGISHFAPVDKANKRNNNQSERYFGFARSGTNIPQLEFKEASTEDPASVSADYTKELSQSLFIALVKLLEKKGIQRNKIVKLHGNQILVKNMNNNKISGRFPCILCTSSRKKSFTAQLIEKSGRNYWSLSNYSLHIKGHLENKQMNNDAMESDVEVFDEHFSPQPFDETAEIICFDRVVDQVEGNDHEDAVTMDLKIEALSDEQEFFDMFTIIYNQVSKQLGIMNDAVLSYNEEEHSMSFILTDTQHPRTLQVAEVPADGNCLFGALIHQLNRPELKSSEHSRMAVNLRADVVAYIKQNVDSFEHELKGAVLNENEGKKCRNMKKKCTDFLFNELPKQSQFGGIESLKAVREMKGVNILIINEHGTGYFSPCSFDKGLDQTVVLAYRLKHKTSQVNVSNIDRNHYDSVVRMEQSDVYDLSRMLASIAWKKEAAQNETIQLVT